MSSVLHGNFNALDFELPPDKTTEDNKTTHDKATQRKTTQDRTAFFDLVEEYRHSLGEKYTEELSDEEKDSRSEQYRRMLVEEYEEALGSFHLGKPDLANFAGEPTFERFVNDYAVKRLGYVDLPFPLHISEIRGNRQDQTSLPQILNLLENSRTFFPVLTPKNQGKDLMPSFSDLDKTSAALVMSNLLSTLSAERIRYVGIAASDVLDTIYLAREVHTHCPDATLFSFGGNLLFLNPDIAGDLRGTLVVTSYPLFTLNQHWTTPWKSAQAHQFPSEAAEGLFNATLALLDQPQEMLEYAPPFASPRPEEGSSYPPVWITAVGNEGLVPIRVLRQTPGFSQMYFYPSQGAERLPSDAKKPGPAKVEPDIEPDTSSWAALLAFWTATLLSAWFGALALWLWKLRGHKSIWRARLGGSSENRMLALTAFLINLLAFYLIVSGLFILPPPPAFKFAIPESVKITSRIALLLLSLCGLIYLLKSAIAWWRLWDEGRAALLGTPWPNPPPAEQQPYPMTISSMAADALSAFALVLVPLVSCLLVWAYLSGLFKMDPNPYEQAGLIFGVWRYVTPGNGESPLAPLFFATLAVVLWSASNVWRTAMLEAMTGDDDARGQASDTLQASYLGMDSASLKDLKIRQKRIRSLLSRGSLGLPFGSLVFLLLTAFFLATLTRVNFDDFKNGLKFYDTTDFLALSSVEGPRFDGLFAFLLWTAYIAVAFNLLRTLNLWYEFRELLRRLSWHPLREACGSLAEMGKEPPKGEELSERSPGQVPELSLGSAIPTFTALEFSVEQAERLVGRGTELLAAAAQTPVNERLGTAQPEMCKLLIRMKSRLAVALKFDATGDYRKRRKAVLKVQADAARMSSIVANILEPDWRLPAAAVIPDNNFEDRWRHAAGLFLASRILDYSRHILAQLRYLLGFTIIGLFLMLMSVSSYPFPNSDTLLRFSWTMLLVGAAVSVWVLVQVSRDRILSLLSGETPGKIDWTFGFVGHLALYGLLPVLTVLGIQFPATLSGIIQSLGSILPGGAAH